MLPRGRRFGAAVVELLGFGAAFSPRVGMSSYTCIFPFGLDANGLELEFSASTMTLLCFELNGFFAVKEEDDPEPREGGKLVRALRARCCLLLGEADVEPAADADADDNEDEERDLSAGCGESAYIAKMAPFFFVTGMVRGGTTARGGVYLSRLWCLSLDIWLCVCFGITGKGSLSTVVFL